MNRFVPLFVVAAVFVFGNGQLGFAQIQILDGDGKQVAPNVIPTEKMDQLPAEQVPEMGPQIFGGNGSSIIIRKSFRSVDENGDLKTESSGKAIVIGPDGKRQEFDLNEGKNQPLIVGGMRIDGLTPDPAKEQTKSFSLGVQSSPVHPAVASQLNLESGLMVSQVAPGSPAATAGVQLYDVLLFADQKQLTNKADLTKAVQAAGEVDASISLALIRGGKEISVVVKPEKRSAGQINQGQMIPGPMNGMPQLGLPNFDPNELFQNELFGDGIEARMKQQMEEMQERVLQMQKQLGNGLIEMPRLQEQRRE